MGGGAAGGLWTGVCLNKHSFFCWYLAHRWLHCVLNLTEQILFLLHWIVLLMCIGKRRLALKTGLWSRAQKTSSINQYGAGPKHPKTGRVDNFRNKVTYSLLKIPNQVYMPIFSQFDEIVCQRLFNIVRIIQTTALKLFSCRLFTWFWRFGYTCTKDVAGEKRSMANDTIPVRCKCACRP